MASFWADQINKKGHWASREIEHKILDLLGGLFKGDSGGRSGEGALAMIGRGFSGVFEAHPGIPVPLVPDSPLLLGSQRFSRRSEPAPGGDENGVPFTGPGPPGAAVHRRRPGV